MAKAIMLGGTSANWWMATRFISTVPILKPHVNNALATTMKIGRCTGAGILLKKEEAGFGFSSVSAITGSFTWLFDAGFFRGSLMPYQITGKVTNKPRTNEARKASFHVNQLEDTKIGVLTASPTEEALASSAVALAR